MQDTAVDEEVEKLSEEERVSLRSTEQHLTRGVVELGATHIGAQQPLARRFVERCEGKQLGRRQPVPPVVAGDLRPAEPHVQHGRSDATGQPRQRRAQHRRRPLGVVDDEDKRALFGERRQHGRDRINDGVARQADDTGRRGVTRTERCRLDQAEQRKDAISD